MLTLNIFTIINLIALSLLMGVRKVNTTSNKLIAWIIVLPAFPFFVNYLVAVGFIGELPFLLGFNISFLWAPFILWYVKSMLKQKVTFNFWKLIHGVPLLIDIAYGIYLQQQSKSYITSLVANLKDDIFPWQLEALNGLMITLIFAYLGYSLFLVNNWKPSDSDYELMMIKIKWLKQFLILLIALIVLLSGSYLFVTPVTVDFFVVPILYNIFYFWVVYKSFSSSGIFADFTYNINIKEEIQHKEKYTNSRLTEDQLTKYKHQLISYIESHFPYRNAGLTIGKLAVDTGIPPHHLSQLINQQFDKNFFDFINFYRVEQTKRLINDESYKHLTLEAIGAEAGFGSRNAFYTAFKKHTGITPSSYLKSLIPAKTTPTL